MTKYSADMEINYFPTDADHNSSIRYRGDYYVYSKRDHTWFLTYSPSEKFDPHFTIGMVLRHNSGRVYTVTMLTNTAHKDQIRKPEAVLLGANGNWWSRDIDTMTPDKFTVLFDGTNLAEDPATTAIRKEAAERADRSGIWNDEK